MVDPDYEHAPTLYPKVTKVSISDIETKIGNNAYFYVLPQKEHKIRVALRKGGDKINYDVNVSLPPFNVGQTTYAGHKYKLILQIYGPQEIGLKATLKDWEYTEGENDIPIEL